MTTELIERADAPLAPATRQTEQETAEDRFGPEPEPSLKPKTFDDWPDMTGGHARTR